MSLENIASRFERGNPLRAELSKNVWFFARNGSNPVTYLKMGDSEIPLNNSFESLTTEFRESSYIEALCEKVTPHVKNTATHYMDALSQKARQTQRRVDHTEGDKNPSNPLLAKFMDYFTLGAAGKRIRKDFLNYAKKSFCLGIIYFTSKHMEDYLQSQELRGSAKFTQIKDMSNFYGYIANNAWIAMEKTNNVLRVAERVYEPFILRGTDPYKASQQVAEKLFPRDSC